MTLASAAIKAIRAFENYKKDPNQSLIKKEAEFRKITAYEASETKRRLDFASFGLCYSDPDGKNYREVYIRVSPSGAELDPDTIQYYQL